MRALILILALFALVACDEQPDDLVLSGAAQTETDSETADADTDAEKDGETDETVETKPVVITANNPTISDSQDFDAVTGRISIEEDKEILKAQREKFQVIDPTKLPDRSDGTVNVAKYALTSKNKVGVKVYKRFSVLGEAALASRCGKYRLPDDAQAAFLKAGGPERDPKGLDPDGDGYACTWTPDYYRNLLK